MIVGGNIDGFTRVMTTAIALETSKGDLPLALALGLVLLGVVLALNVADRGVRRWRERRGAAAAADARGDGGVAMRRAAPRLRPGAIAAGTAAAVHERAAVQLQGVDVRFGARAGAARRRPARSRAGRAAWR